MRRIDPDFRRRPPQRPRRRRKFGRSAVLCKSIDHGGSLLAPGPCHGRLSPHKRLPPILDRVSTPVCTCTLRPAQPRGSELRLLYPTSLHSGPGAGESGVHTHASPPASSLSANSAQCSPRQGSRYTAMHPVVGSTSPSPQGGVAVAVARIPLVMDVRTWRRS